MNTRIPSTCFLLILLILSVYHPLFGQRNPCADGSCGPVYEVTQPSGLIMLKDPWESSGKVTKIPHKGRVYASDSLYGETMTLAGQTGKFKKVKLNNFSGYMFEGFLKKVEKLELYSCRTLKETETAFTSGETLLGIYVDDKGTALKSVQARPHGVEGDADYIVNSAAPVFLLKNFQPDEPNYTSFGEKVDRFIAPGDVVTLKAEKTDFSQQREYFLYGTGSVVADPKGVYTEIFKEVSGYALRIRAMEGANQIKDTDIFGTSTVPYKFGLEAQGPKVIWAGDMDGDRKLDILLQEPQKDDCWSWSLFLSSQAEKGYLFKEVASRKFCGY